jgi:membrane fusion protein, heavy metal efflux system
MIMKYTVLLLIATLVLLGCGTAEPAAPETEAAHTDSTITLTEAQLKNAGIQTDSIKTKEIASVLKVNGRIDVPPQNMVSISVPNGGYLKTTKLLPGMHINKGDIIAVIEDQQYIQMQQDYLTAKTKMGYLENEYKRQKELNQSQASSDKVYQQSETDYKTQQILLTSLTQKLELAGIALTKITATSITRSVNIHSPINGYVSKVNVNIGKYVSPTDVLFELINPLDIHLALTVFETSLDKLYIGQPLIAYTNNNPGKKYRCEVLLIGKDLSREGNTDVHCHFEEYDKSLVPGTYMNAEIQVKNAKVAAVPEDAVVRFENQQYVFVTTGARQYAMTPVTVGESENGFTALLSAQNLLGKELVVKGAYSLLMGLKNKSEE